MRRVHVNILMVLLLSVTLTSLSHAGANCCDPAAGCCSTSGISGDQQRLRAPSTGSNHTKIGTVKKPAPQINPMSWSDTVNKIGTVRLAPTSVSSGCCPGTNNGAECCESVPKSTLPPRLETSMSGAISASSPFLGTLW